jgi:hydroxymethylglutaryl-CoA lyase
MSNFITITEVGPRDGFQNIKQNIPTETKIRIIDDLVKAGITSMEITSMVSPKAIPQMADARLIIEHVLTNHQHIKPFVLVPNAKGAQLSYDYNIRNINYVISVSPAHNKANINRTVEESLDDLYKIRHDFPDLNISLSLATVFGCPFIGETSLPSLLDIIRFAVDHNINNITLCDTIGVANPAQTRFIIEAITSTFRHLDIGLHMHNTHGMAFANMLVGLQSGITRFETAIGGLGGCPFAPGAAGNASTEDTVNMLNRMGYQTGISLDRLLEIIPVIRENIEQNLLSNLSRARSYREFNFFDNKNITFPG